MSKLFYPAVFHPEETGYSVSVPDLDGCFTEGDTLEEAYNMAFDAIGLCITDILNNKQKVPAASVPKKVSRGSDDFVVLIEFDMTAYLKKHDSKAVKKTLTIPSWLNQAAEEKHINFSGVLQKALMEQLDIAQ